MPTTVTSKGQVTIPKAIRDKLNISVGTQLDFGVDDFGQVILRKAKQVSNRKKDRFDAARGTAEIPWRTEDLMALLRSEQS